MSSAPSCSRDAGTAEPAREGELPVVELRRFRVELRERTRQRIGSSASLIDGRSFLFRYGFEYSESDACPGEIAWQPWDESYPPDAVPLIASGDLRFERIVFVRSYYPGGRCPWGKRR